MGVAEKVVDVVVNVCRIIVGVAIVYSGVELLRGTGLLANSSYDSTLTALFAICLGLYCIFRGGPAQLLESMQRRQKQSFDNE